MIKNKKGISVMSLVAAVAIIMILLTTVTVSGINTAHNAKKIAFGAEIKMIQGAVDAYYKENNAIYPIKNDAYTITIGDNVSSKNKVIFENNEGNGIASFTVYAIDYDLIGVDSLIYGKDSENYDIYVVSRKSGKVYYLKGLKIGSEIYYTVTDDIDNLLSYNSEKNTVNSPVIKFEPSTTEWTSDDVTIKVTIPNGYSVSSVKYNDGSTEFNNNEVKVERNGTLVITYTDEKGESKNVKYIVSNIDKDVPNVPNDKLVFKNVETSDSIGYIEMSKSDELSGIKNVKYDYGDYSTLGGKYFKSAGIYAKEDLIFVKNYNEPITLYVEDAAGNFILKVVDVKSDTNEVEVITEKK